MAAVINFTLMVLVFTCAKKHIPPVISSMVKKERMLQTLVSWHRYLFGETELEISKA